MVGWSVDTDRSVCRLKLTDRQVWSGAHNGREESDPRSITMRVGPMHATYGPQHESACDQQSRYRKSDGLAHLKLLQWNDRRRMLYDPRRPGGEQQPESQPELALCDCAGRFKATILAMRRSHCPGPISWIC